MILISYPHVSCYNNIHINTHNYSHTHHTHVTCGTAEGCLAYLYEEQSLLNFMCLFQSTLNSIVPQNVYLCVTTVTLTQL